MIKPVSSRLSPRKRRVTNRSSMANDLESRIASLEFSNERLREQISELRLFLRIFALEAAVSLVAEHGGGPDAIRDAGLFLESLGYHLDEEAKQLSPDDRSVQRTRTLIESFGQTLMKELEELGEPLPRPHYESKPDEPAQDDPS